MEKLVIALGWLAIVALAIIVLGLIVVAIQGAWEDAAGKDANNQISMLKKDNKNLADTVSVLRAERKEYKEGLEKDYSNKWDKLAKDYDNRNEELTSLYARKRENLEKLYKDELERAKLIDPEIVRDKDKEISLLKLDIDSLKEQIDHLNIDLSAAFAEVEDTKQALESQKNKALQDLREAEYVLMKDILTNKIAVTVNTDTKDK